MVATSLEYEAESSLHRRSILISQIKFVVIVSLMALAARAAIPQEKSAAPRPHPAPQISGRLIGTDNVRELILEYKRDARKGTFIGTIQSTCMIPAKPNSSESLPLDLSGIPRGSQLTVFYVRHARKLRGVERAENIILAVRFDRLNGDSAIPVEKMIPCYKAAQTPVSK